VLDEADALTNELDQKAADGLRAQIQTRRDDITRYESET
jgi:hypothetical protein